MPKKIKSASEESSPITLRWVLANIVSATVGVGFALALWVIQFEIGQRDRAGAISNSNWGPALSTATNLVHRFIIPLLILSGMIPAILTYVLRQKLMKRKIEIGTLTIYACFGTVWQYILGFLLMSILLMLVSVSAALGVESVLLYYFEWFVTLAIGVILTALIGVYEYEWRNRIKCLRRPPFFTEELPTHAEEN